MKSIIDALVSLLKPILEGKTSYIYANDPKVYNQPRATSTPIPTPVPQTSEQFFNFAPHIDENTKRTIYAPPQEDLPLYQQYFPNEATSSAVAAFNESMYNPQATNVNTKPGPNYGTLDRGYFQMNDNSVKDLFKYYPNTMKNIGVNNYQDWTNNKWQDKATNFAVAKLYRDKFEDRTNKAPWTSWYGWQDQGFKNVGAKNINYSQQ